MMKKIAAELAGAALLVLAIVGAGYMAAKLTTDTALQLLINALSASLMLFVIINLFGKVSGAHFNPVVTLLKRLRGKISNQQTVYFIAAQILGGAAGALLANAMFSDRVLQISTTARTGTGLFIGEVIATFGLLLIVTIRPKQAASLIPAWIASAYFFTASTSFANPAVTLGRVFTDSVAGISPESVFGFICAQLIGLVLIFLLAPSLKKASK